jgi:hypothetical protein
MKTLALSVAITAFSASALAAGIDSRAYTCAGLHALVETNRFIFIGNPNFQDFVVSGPYYCGGGQYVQLRSVPTSDNPECTVNYCVSVPDQQR